MRSYRSSSVNSDPVVQTGTHAVDARLSDTATLDTPEWRTGSSSQQMERRTIMGKCYAHEECEYNGQPECHLPDGVPCPHGVTADKPAAESKTDIEALIERLNQYSQSLIAYQMGGEFSDVCVDAATALSTLQAENKRMRREIADLETQHRTEMCESGYDCVELGKARTKLEEVKRALAEMWFAYENKDGEIPHTYEEEAVELAQEILGPWGECMLKYLRRGPHKED
jgi:hypothetical protein